MFFCPFLILHFLLPLSFIINCTSKINKFIVCIVHDIDRRIDFMSSLELTDLPIRDGHVSKRSPTTRSKPHDIIIHILFLCKKRTCYLLAYLCRLNLDYLNVRSQLLMSKRNKHHIYALTAEKSPARPGPVSLIFSNSPENFLRKTILIFYVPFIHMSNVHSRY